MRVAWMGLAAVAMVAVLMTPGRAKAQGAVAFTPNVGSIPDGVSLNATPVVSADRRYVRLGLSPGFQTVNGFQTFPVPGAVGGGGFRSMMGGMNTGFNAGPSYPDYVTAYAPNGPTVPPTPRAVKAAKARAAKKAAHARKPLPDPVVMPIKKKTEPRG